MSELGTPLMRLRGSPSGDVEGAVVPEAGAVGFTPGPWKIDAGFKRSGATYSHSVRCSAQHMVEAISIYPTEIDTRRLTANARLIAAAPELYDALNVALGWATGGMDGDWRECDHIQLMRDALAKATAPQQERAKP